MYLIFLQGRQILLARRQNTGFHDGEYSLPAGHVEGNESFTQAMVREAHEEIGVELRPEDVQVVHVMHRKEPTEERVNFFFRARQWCGHPQIMEPQKCDDVSWFDMRDLPQNIIPYVRHVLTCIRHGAFYSEYGW